MNTLTLTLGILLVNTVISVIFIIMAAVNKDMIMAQSGFVMLVCPVVGIIFYAMAHIVFRWLLRKKEVDRDDVTFSKKRVRKAQMLNYDEEVAVVPIEESLIVANELDRRQSLLNKLKKDYNNNIPAIMKAVENEDTETAHYAASVIMNVNQSYMSSMREFAAEYKKAPEDYELNRAYMDCIIRYIDSEILSKIEKSKYMYLYLSIATNMYEIFPSNITTDDFQTIIMFNINLLRRDEALRWCNLCFAHFPDSEDSYLNKLKACYYLDMRSDFFETLDTLRDSVSTLSQKGIDLLRFFTEWGGFNVNITD